MIEILICSCSVSLFDETVEAVDQNDFVFLFEGLNMGNKKLQESYITSLSSLIQMEPYFRGTVCPMIDEPYEDIGLGTRISKLRESMFSLHSLQMKLKVLHYLLGPFNNLQMFNNASYCSLWFFNISYLGT